MPRRAVVVTVIAAALAACDGLPGLPTAPSEWTSGVVIYEHANYLGTSAAITTDVEELSRFDGPCKHEESNDGNTHTFYDWDDCISSIRVAPGWRAMIFTSADFSGARLMVTADVPNLQLVEGRCDHDGLNDCITSIRLLPP
jgi:hypothetical protein